MQANHTDRIVKAVQMLSLARSMERVMEIVRKEARELTGADGATFVLRDNGMCYYADEDAITPLWKGSRFPMNACISGWAMLNRKSVVIEDIYVDDRIPHDAYRPTFVKSLAMVPIRTVAPIGAIGTYWRTKYRPTEEQVTLLQSLADITTVTIENVNLYNELEQRVRERTMQLEDAMARLQFANEELEAFSYSVSHDLRAPLRSVIANSHILEEENDGTLKENALRTLRKVQDRAQHMNTLIEDLLRFSKIVNTPLEKKQVDSKELVERVISDLKMSTPEKSVIQVHPLLPVIGDPRLLYHVWINLVSNAVKYSSRKEHPVIEIRSEVKGDTIVFSVADNGAGFEMDYADKLFRVFQRLHDSTEFEGTGAGLALTKRIITRHGGRIWANAKVDEGAIFHFCLPAARPEKSAG